jgi:hypothetical protein
LWANSLDSSCSLGVSDDELDIQGVSSSSKRAPLISERLKCRKSEIHTVESDNKDELFQPVYWLRNLRFGATATTINTSPLGDEPVYTKQVEDFYCKQEFYEFIGKEIVHGKQYYMAV